MTTTQTTTPKEHRDYLAAAANLRALFGPPMVELETFGARARELLLALSAMGLSSERLAELRRMADETLAGGQGRPLFRAILGHYLRQLRELGVMPQSQHEDPSATIERVSALIRDDPSLVVERVSSRRATGIVNGPEPTMRAESMLRQARSVTIERPNEPATALREVSLSSIEEAPGRDSISGSMRAVEPPARRLIVLEEPADSDVLVPVKSNYRVMPVPIGEGGVAKVYRGRDVDTGLKVAVKVVTIPDVSKRAVHLGLFQNEREIQGSIDSDAIVRIYKTGLTGNGQPYIVMELLTGGSLVDHLDRIAEGKRRFQLDEAMHIGAMAIEAVGAAHRRGVIHKDIKPDNFLFSEDKKHLKLGDFGISEFKTRLTSDVNGTIGYIPPETFEATLDSEARDLFALGVTLYQLFAGRLPFTDDSPSASYVDMTRRVPEPPSQVRPERAVPVEVDQIVLRALARTRAVRYADADQMLFDFVTSEVRAFLDEATAKLRATPADANDPDFLGRQKMWMQAVREALRRLAHIEESFASERIQRWRLTLACELCAHADRVGDEALLRETRELIRHLDPQSERLDETTITVASTFHFDDPTHLLRTTKALFTVCEFDNEAGILQLRSVEQSAHFLRTLEFERGRVLALGVEGPGLAPTCLPLPVRPGRHRVRIPIYAAGDIPEGTTIVTAGQVPSRSRHGSYSEEISAVDVRTVDHDFAISNLVTNGEYLKFLHALRDADDEEEALYRIPSVWTLSAEGVRGADGELVLLDEPVRGLRYEDVLAYLESVDREIRLPTLNEMKRASRGNDARLFPWGDGFAQKPSTAAFQFIGFLPASAPMKSIPDNAMLADRSPFSVPAGRLGFRRAVYHLVGNVTQFLSLGASPEDRAPILGAFPSTRGLDPRDARLNAQFFVTFGLPFNSPAPTNSDIIGLQRARPDPDAEPPRFPFGFRWVKPLRIVGMHES
jgi:hypothetical protein